MNLKFQFDSLADFIEMSGHGPYVWLCYLLTAIALGYLVVSPMIAQKRFKKSLQRQEKLAQAQSSNPVDKVT